MTDELVTYVFEVPECGEKCDSFKPESPRLVTGAEGEDLTSRRLVTDAERERARTCAHNVPIEDFCDPCNEQGENPEPLLARALATIAALEGALEESLYREQRNFTHPPSKDSAYNKARALLADLKR